MIVLRYSLLGNSTSANPQISICAQDGPELAAALRDVAQAAAVPWAQVPAADIEKALRKFEHQRSTRCAPLVAQARQNGRRLAVKRSWLVSPCPCLSSCLPVSGIEAIEVECRAQDHRLKAISD